jgi:hypothetical protein
MASAKACAVSGIALAARITVGTATLAASMLNQSSQILNFPFHGVGARVAALSASATVVGVDRKVSAQFVS